MNNFSQKVSFIWSVADLLRGPYEIPLTRHFYEYTPPRPLEDIEADIKAVEKDIVRMLAEATA